MADEAALSPKYSLVKLNVASGTQLTTRAATVVKHLSDRDEASKATVIVCLSTKSRNANKSISIVEIAKRELNTKDVKVFQYNALSSEMVEVERKPKAPAGTEPGADDAGGEDGGESDDAFETMGAKGEEGPKKRLLPVMSTYLSRVSVQELKASLGEQR